MLKGLSDTEGNSNQYFTYNSINITQINSANEYNSDTIIFFQFGSQMISEKENDKR
jgi:hypothetical protein